MPPGAIVPGFRTAKTRFRASGNARWEEDRNYDLGSFKHFERPMTKKISKDFKSYRALTYLSLFALAITIPLLLLLGTLLLQSASVQRAQLENRVSQVLDALVSDIDRDLDRDITILRTLATSEALKNGQWRAFYDQAKSGLQGRAYLVLIDSNGRQLVNTYVPYGQQPAVTGDPETVRRILQTKAPVVSNLFVSLVAKKPVFNVSIPVLQDGQVRYVMSLGLLPDDLVALLTSQNLGSEWVTLIWDANGVILARSRDNTRYVGTPLPENMREHAQRGIVRTRNLDGTDVLHATARSIVSGWGVGMNIPYSLITEQMRNSLLLWATAAVFAIGISMAFGLYFARQITTPLSIAASAAAAFGHGEPFTITNSRLNEADAFLTALREAQQTREKLTEELKQSRDWLQTTLSSIGDAVIATDTQGTVTFLNPVAESLTGWTEKDAVGRPLHEVFHIVNEQTRLPVENPALRAIREGVIVGLANHTLLVAKDGIERPIDDAGSPIRDEHGKTIGSVLIFRDVTERRRFEQEREKAAQAAQRLAAIVESSDDAIVATNFDLRITAWNLAAEKMFGYRASEAIGQSIRLIIPMHRWDEELEVMGRIQDGHRVEHFETERCRKGNVLIPVSLTASPIYDSAGAIVGASKSLRDITERKRIEAQLLQSQQTLGELVERAPFGVYIVDSQFRIAHMNIGSQSGTFRNVRPVIGRDFPEAMRVLWPEPVAEDVIAVFRHTLETGEPYYSPRFTNQRLDIEAEESYEWELHRMTLPDGQFGVICYYFNSTRLRQSEQREQVLRQTAEQANRAKDEFLAMVSHELRNPLSAILGWAAILKQGDTPAERVEQAYEVIERNARAEARLVESLLELSRIAAGQLKLDSERVDLPVLLETIIDSVRPAADTKSIKLEMTSPQAIVLIGDAGRLQQVFSNLLTNAVKFTPPGGHIRISVRRSGSHAQIQVVDNGDGISPDFLPHIFDRFRQAESTTSRKHGGLGLGLAIVHELVQAHGGTVTAESPGRGRGCTFTVILPIPAIIPADIEPASPPLVHKTVFSLSGFRILVVDDDPDARELVGITLESSRAVVQLASSASEALLIISRDRPDVMIADIGMPHEDGYVLIQTLRALERGHSHPRLPAIALTAYASVEDREKLLAAGYDIHLAKPVGPGDLVSAVSRFPKARDYEA
jgi:PAS domain S-box-containing protein